MPTRQYIGARYVPKFYTNSVDGSAAWESNVVYEPLTYVTLTNGHMYISKKEVPATVGTPASNISYWLDCGSYNGFIDDLQSQINTLNANKGDKAAIGTVETLGSAPSRTYYGGEVFLGNDGKEYVVTVASIAPPTVLDSGADGNCVQTTINAELGKLNTALDDKVNTSDIANNLTTSTAGKVLDARQGKILNDKINKYHAKKYLVISDSYGNYVDGDGRNFVGRAFHFLNSNDFYDFHGGGAGFASSSLTFLQVLQSHESAISDKTSITDVIVCGSANDQGKSETDLRTAITAFRDYIYENYPNAKIHIGAFSHSLESSTIANIPTTTYRYKKLAAQCGVAYMDNSEWAMRRKSFYTDTDAVHPTTDGIDACAQALASYILNGSISIVDHMTGCFKLKNASVGTINDQTRQEYINGIVSLKQRSNVSSFAITLASAVNLTNGSYNWADLLEFNDTFIFPTSNNSLGIEVRFTDASHEFFGTLYFKNLTNYLVESMGIIVRNPNNYSQLSGTVTVSFGATSFSVFG